MAPRSVPIVRSQLDETSLACRHWLGEWSGFHRTAEESCKSLSNPAGPFVGGVGARPTPQEGGTPTTTRIASGSVIEIRSGSRTQLRSLRPDRSESFNDPAAACCRAVPMCYRVLQHWLALQDERPDHTGWRRWDSNPRPPACKFAGPGRLRTATAVQRHDPINSERLRALPFCYLDRR